MKHLKLSEIPFTQISGVVGRIYPELKFDFSGCNTFDEIQNDGSELIAKYQFHSHQVTDLINAIRDGFNERARAIGCKEMTSYDIEVSGKFRFTPILHQIEEDPGQLKDPNKDLTFSDALMYVKQGNKVQRQGWNGKGMWLLLISGHPSNRSGDDGYGDLLKIHDELDKEMELLPWIGMKTVDNKFVPWLASQTDILAEDWQIVE